MFRLECLVDDSKLAKVHWALDGLVFDLKILPVRNAKAANGKVVEKVPGLRPSGIIAAIVSKASKGDTITAKQLRGKMVDEGFYPNSYCNPVKLLVESGVLRKTKKPGVYTRTERAVS